MAATLAPERISVTLPGDVSDFLHRRAARQGATVPDTLVSIAVGIMECEEDEISNEEERYLVERAEKNRKASEGKRLHTHAEAWGVL